MRYKFRAETWEDCALILAKLGEDFGEEFTSFSVALYEQYEEFPGQLELGCEIETTVDPFLLREAIGSLVDCHVAAESLKPSEDFDGERDDVFSQATLRDRFERKLLKRVGNFVQVEYHGSGDVYDWQLRSFKDGVIKLGDFPAIIFLHSTFTRWEFGENSATEFAPENVLNGMKMMTITLL